jgi:hypothetical protein
MAKVFDVIPAKAGSHTSALNVDPRLRGDDNWERVISKATKSTKPYTRISAGFGWPKKAVGLAVRP